MQYQFIKMDVTITNCDQEVIIYKLGITKVLMSSCKNKVTQQNVSLLILNF
jgi:hypothetical protein